MTTTTVIDFGAINAAQRAVTSGEGAAERPRLAGTFSGEVLGRFADDLADVAGQFNRVDDAAVGAPSQYLEAVGVGR